MNQNKASRNSEDLFNRIHSLSDEAEWSVDELREVLRDEGIDPDKFVKDIKTRIKDLLKVSPRESEQQNESASASLLPRLRLLTGLKATAIAEKMGVSVSFLSDLSSYPDVIPFGARKESAKRAAISFPGVAELDVLNSFSYALLQPAAAFRDDPFPEEEVDFEKIVRRSDMSEEQKQYWLSLAEEEQSL